MKNKHGPGFLIEFPTFDKIIKRSVIGTTGARQKGDFLQKRVPNKIPFPCTTKGYRSETIPTNVHQLRPGKRYFLHFVRFIFCNCIALNAMLYGRIPGRKFPRKLKYFMGFLDSRRV